MNNEKYLKNSKEIYDLYKNLMNKSNLFFDNYMNNDEIIENNSNEEFVFNIRNFDNLLRNERILDNNELNDLLDEFDEILYKFDNENVLIKKEKIVNISGYNYKVNIELIE